LVGGVLVKISVAGTYLRYVKPSARWLLIAAGVVLLVLAAVTIVGAIRERSTADHDHVHSGSTVGWLLVAPALALLLLGPPAIGAFQASRSGTALTAPADSNFAPLPDGDPVRISVLDYASRAVFDNGHSLAGRRVTLSGFIMMGPNGTPYLARMIVTCCAA